MTVVEAQQKDIIFNHLIVSSLLHLLQVGSVPQDALQTETFGDLWSGILLPVGFPNKCTQRLSINIGINNRPAINIT